MEEGASAAAIKVMMESTLANTRKRHYKGPQVQWILHCSTNSIDPFIPIAVKLLHILTNGIETKQWSPGTVNSYRSVILKFNAIKRFTNTPIDIAPVLGHFRAMGPNSNLEFI
ncbi:hypothetical protein BGX24_002054 [Mortierella sp. AD032]|nr:hypothetical protein BGX24_002054 [Mortierella sp. AD032]